MVAPKNPLLDHVHVAWPEIELDDEVFLSYLAETAHHPIDDGALGDLDLPSLYLGCACVRGEPRALAAFEAKYLDQLPTFVARITRDASLLDEIKQRLRIKLFIAETGRIPTIARYRRGSLAAWLRVVACRMTIDLLRERNLPMVTLDESSLERAAMTEDPMLSHLKATYRAHVSDAFAAALHELAANDRTVLRLRFIDDLGTNEIGKIYGLSKSAVSRQLGRCRTRLLAAVKRRLVVELGIDEAELDAIMQLVSSQLHVSLPRLLRSTP